MAEQEICENCGRMIGKLEPACVWQEHVVCGTCHSVLSAPQTAKPPVSAPPVKATTRGTSVLSAPAAAVPITPPRPSQSIADHAAAPSPPGSEDPSPSPAPRTKAVAVVAIGAVVLTVLLVAGLGLARILRSSPVGAVSASVGPSITATASEPPKRDYSKGPNGEVPKPFTLYVAEDGKSVQMKKSLGRPKGISVQGNMIFPNGEGIYHGKITATNEIGTVNSSPALWDESVMVLFCTYQGKGEMYFWADMPEGTLRLWYPDGKKRFELPYVKGKRNGLATVWYETGAKEAEATYVDDRLDGMRTFWYRNGQLWYRAQYTKGRLGPGTYWDKDGTVLFDKSRSPEYQVTFMQWFELIDGQLDGATDKDTRESIKETYRDTIRKNEVMLSETKGALKTWLAYHGNEPNDGLRASIDTQEGQIDGMKSALDKR